MIEARVRKKLGQFLLASELVDDGFICLAGRNGSGKTSFLKTIAGFLQADEGYVRINGVDITQWPVERRGVVMVTPSSFFPRLEVDSHIAWGARIKGVQIDSERVSQIKQQLGISFRGVVRKLSLGMRERVALATALLSSPKLILIDEAFANLDSREEFVRNYRDLSKSSSIDVIFTTQYPLDSRQADHLYNMENGSVTRVF